MTLEYLSKRIWITPEKVTVTIDHVPNYEDLATKALELASKGASTSTIAGVLGTDWATADQAIQFAKSGQRPKSKPAGRKHRCDRRGKYKLDATEIVRLRDEEKWAFRKIAKRYGVNPTTVARAYDRARPELVRNAAEKGRMPKRGSYTQLPLEVFDQIRAGLANGKNPEEIAVEVGCGRSTVCRVRQEMKSTSAYGFSLGKSG